MTLTLVLGGARSGKSRHAEGLVTARPAPWLFVATAQAYDEEMRSRIAEHRGRRIAGWSTVEAPIDAAGAVADAPPDMPVLLDCLTLWLTNLMLGGHDLPLAVNGLAAALATRRAATVIVSNELGLGIVPDNALARRFRDEHGRMNQRMAEAADRVVFMVAGLPMTVKETP